VTYYLQIALHLKVCQFAEFLLLPPGPVLVCQQASFWRLEIEALHDAMQAILGHRELLGEPPAEGDQRAQFTHMLRRYPDLRDNVSD
jgi:hypothetical protein